MTAAIPPWERRSVPLSPRRSAEAICADDLAELWRRGGWDYRLPPHDAWRRVLGDVPYPTDQELAEHPTLGPLDNYLEDPDVTDLHLNGPGRELCIRRSGDLVELGTRETLHSDWLPWLIHQLRSRGRGAANDIQVYGSIDMTRPGRRVCLVRYEALLRPLCPHGPAITLRVLRPGQMTLERLVQLETLSGPAAELLAGCMRAGVDIVIVGTAGAGKTTLAQALLYTVADQRVLCIEDVQELIIPNERAVQVVLATVGQFTFADLIRTALRKNPTRIVVGETRGREAYSVIAAARNGYPILTTLHGDSALHGLHNLAAMAMEAPEMQGTIDMVYATLNGRPLILVALTRQRGRRHIMEIVELQRQFGAARPVVEVLFTRQRLDLVQVQRPSHALLAQLDTAGALTQEDIS